MRGGQEEVTMHLPVEVGDFTDFYASREHATTCGEMLRGRDNALHPNWCGAPQLGANLSDPDNTLPGPSSTAPRLVKALLLLKV